MNIITVILESVVVFCISLISSLGYFGVFFLMMLESMIFPIPSELVLPFAGFLIIEGKMNFLLVILFATFGSLVGSLLSYYLGKYGGNRFVLKYGKYFLLNERHLINAEKWFSKRGELTIFIGRFIPVIRHIISIPAGVGKMNIKKFILYTLLGAGIWNAFLTYVGFTLGKNWETIMQYSDYISWFILGVIIMVGAYFLWKEIKKRREKSKRRVVLKL
jgi:membrane protein DedA with SNARE-associated domain